MDMVAFLQQQLTENANPDKAPQMQAYMKTQQPFLGVAAPVRKKLFSEAKKKYVITTHDEYQDIVLRLWKGIGRQNSIAYREDQYQALEVAERYKKFRTDESMDLYENLLASAENWDTVDWIGINLVGQLIKSHRELESKLVSWREHENFWFRRTALIAQIKHKADTNKDLLADTVLMLCHEQEFFIRKAIGWSLREYSKTDPDWVREFVTEYENKLSGLSKREALKIINRAN